MNKAKRVAALLTALALLVTGAAVPLCADALSVEDYVQLALEIAEDDSHGYSQITRWGPDYDCSSLVCHVLKETGFDTGGAYVTFNMRKLLTQHGFEWIPWSSVGSADNLKRGDILLSELYHTEIYLGRGKNVGAHDDFGHWQTGDPSGREISVCNYYNFPWDGVLRYIYDVPTTPPSDLEVDADCENYAAGQTITFSFYSVNSSEQTLEILRGNDVISSIDVSGRNRCTLHINDGGLFGYRLAAGNIIGQTVSDEQTVRVFSGEPYDLYAQADRDVYPALDTVVISLDGRNELTDTLMISDGVSTRYFDVTDMDEFAFSPEKGGVYTYSLIAENPVGTAQSGQKIFTVYDSEPLNVSLSADRTLCMAGDYIGLDVSGEYATERIITVAKDGEMIRKIDAGTRGDLTFRPDDAGVYTFGLEAVNEYGAVVTESADVAVYSGVPQGLSVVTDKQVYKKGEPVTFTLSGDTTFGRTLHIGDTVFDADSDTMTLRFDEAGVYICTLNAANDAGEAVSMPAVFRVYSEKPDKPTLYTNETMCDEGSVIPVEICAENAESVTLNVCVNGIPVYSKDVTGLDGFELPLDRAGIFSVSLTSENPLGTTSSELLYITSCDRPDDSAERYTFREFSWNGDTAAAIFTRRDRDDVVVSKQTEPASMPAAETPDSPATPDTPDSPDEPAKPDVKEIGAFVKIEKQIGDCTDLSQLILTAEVTFGGITYTDTITRDIPSFGHDWKLTSWLWTENNKVSAEFTCENDPTHVETVEASVSCEFNEDEKSAVVTAELDRNGEVYKTARTKIAAHLGDLDGDELSTSADALHILRLSAELENCDRVKAVLADIDFDGIATSSDALGVLRFSTGLLSSDVIGKLCAV